MFLFQTVLTCLALGWLLHRAWQVLWKPLPELIHILGLEVPNAPVMSLADLKPDSVTLHWKQPDSSDSVKKYLIKVNKVTVGESSRSETAITITGLVPSRFYSLGVVAVNASNFKATSSEIPVKTPARDCCTSSQDIKVGAGRDHDSAADLRDGQSDGPTVELATSPFLPSLAGHGFPLTPSQLKPAGIARRNSPMNLSPQSPDTPLKDSPSASEPSLDLLDSLQTVAELTEKFRFLRRVSEEVEQQLDLEEEQFLASRNLLLAERERLKIVNKEREEASAELRKEVAALDRHNRSVQSHRTSKEKGLLQKHERHQKLEQEATQWEAESPKLRDSAKKMQIDKSDMLKSADRALKATRQQIREEQSSLRRREDEFREKGFEVKKLEEERRKLTGCDDEEAACKADSDIEAEWAQELRELQANHTKSLLALQQVSGPVCNDTVFREVDWSSSSQAQENCRQAEERYSWWTSPSPSAAGLPQHKPALTPTDLETPSPKRGKQRRSRHRKSRANTHSSATKDSSNPEVKTSTAPNLTTEFVVPEALPGAFESLLKQQRLNREGDPFTDPQLPVGAGELSPSAGALLPSDLLGDEDPQGDELGSLVGDMLINAPYLSKPGSGSGVMGFDKFPAYPNSPDSMGSRPPSMFSSPRSSLQNVSMYPSRAESMLENDRRSLNSTNSLGPAVSAADDPPSSARRFAGLFNINLNRQRGKAVEDEPPTLGSLKSGQSQSFPRDVVEHTNELDPIGTRRRRTSHSGGWAGPMSTFNFLNRGTAPDAGVSEGNAPAPVRSNTASKRRPFNMFSSKYDPLDPGSLLGEPVSPRPSSMSAFEHGLPRPSSDARPFAWPAMENLAHRAPSLSADWSHRSGDAWSGASSRQGSFHRGSSGSLAIGTTPMDIDPDPYSKPTPIGHRPNPVGVIGSRPQSFDQSVSPKLNPTAPTFKTIFSRSDAKKAERADKAAEQGRDKDPELVEGGSSPALTRSSRDDRSVDTDGSTGGEWWDSLESPYSAGNSPESATAGKDKESIFQKITRKSSSSKFNIPWKDKSGIFSKKLTEPSTPDEGESKMLGDSPATYRHDASAGSPSTSGARSAKSWSTLMRKQKRGDKAASEASEKASEAGDESPLNIFHFHEQEEDQSIL
ncbi:MAG: hypothetical protein M1825_000465 [Sarcosagium campestre]|nr:MAG: hypothetical protein M1825_000465 [Sarcosagium campestre]